MKTLRKKERMTSKERVLTAFFHQEPDRIPINYSLRNGIAMKLKQHFGLAENDNDGLMDTLGVDFREIGLTYTGPNLHKEIVNRMVDPQWGYITRWVEHEIGGNWEHCDYPLEHADEEEISKWPMPSPDDFDYDSLIEKCKKYKDYALYIGNPGLGCIINTAGFFRGMEQAFVDLITDDPAGILLIDRFIDIHLETTARSLEKVGKYIDFVWIGEDLGTQISPIISMDILKTHILPRHKKFIDLANAYNLPVMMHTCGSSSWSFEEYIKIGLKGVDTLQPEATNMSPEYLKKNFGGRLFFNGCISTQGVLTNGTPEDVRTSIRNTLDIMMPGGGYSIAPTNLIQDNTPLENVLAMYEEANSYGWYDK